MLRLVLVYASSTGLQRALVFLAIPLLSGYLTLEALGTYALSQTVAQFAIPLLTWNATVALTREAIEHPGSTAALLKFTIKVSSILAIVMVLAALLLPAPSWLLYGFALGGAEAGFAASIAVLQGREAAKTVLAISLIKTLGIVAAIFATPLFKWDLQHLLVAQIANATLAVVIAYICAARTLAMDNKPVAERPIKLGAMLRYSAATLPHTAALWLSVSSDRLLLGLILGKETVGSYAIAYTVALSVMLLMSGVIAALPPRIARHPEIWRDPEHLRKAIRYVTIAACAVIAMSLAFVGVNLHFFVMVNNMPANAGVLVALIGVGFYTSFYYVLFASYMYLNRDTSALARAGLYIGPINLGLMACLVYLLGSLGAAIGLFLCYANFGIAYFKAAERLEPPLTSIGMEAMRNTGLLMLAAVGAGVWL